MKNPAGRYNLKNCFNKLHYLIWFALFAVLVSSCGTQYKMPNYLENLKDSAKLDTFKFPEPIIQKNDRLYIQVYSETLNPEVVDAPYNSPALAAGTASMSAGNPTLMGYIVDHKGEIEYPRLGALYVEGLTKSQLADLLKDSLKNVLTNPTVNIRFLTFKVNVLGEVGTQGPITIPGEKLTILEAIGMAGGITWNGKRDDVKVIRETNGVREMGLIDLTSQDLFKSPYYHLRQNDIVIVDLNKRGRVTQNEQYAMQRMSFALGIITTFALLISLFR